jgi:hypothetical protein
MPITTDWDNPEKTIIRYHYGGKWNLTEFYAAFETAHKMIDTVNHQVHLIIDVRNSNILPNGVLSQGRTAANRAKHPNQGIIVIVGASGLIRGMFDVFKKLYGRNVDINSYKFASSLEEAHKILGDMKVIA